MGDFTVNVRQKPMDFNRWQLGLSNSLPQSTWSHTKDQGVWHAPV